MASDSDFTLVIGVLKQALKAKKMSYRALGTALGISESGVKKIFGGEDCSYGRLRDVCRVLGVSLTDVLQEIEGSGFRNVEFTPEQHRFFVGHMDYFRFFWKLVFERMPEDEIRRREGMSEAEAFRYLKKLDDLGILRLDAGGKVRLPKVRRIDSFGEGPVLRKIYQEWTAEFLSEMTRAPATSDPTHLQHFVFRCFRMKPETYAEFVAAVREVELEFVRRAVRDLSLYETGLIDARWVSALDPSSFVSRIRK